MGDPRFDMRVMFGGTFFLSSSNEVRYQKGKGCHHIFLGVDPDLISKVELEAMCREDIPLTDIRELWYLIPGLAVDKGLRRIGNDNDSMEMVKLTTKCRLIQMYVVRGTEVSPADLKRHVNEECHVKERRSTRSVVFDSSHVTLRTSPRIAKMAAARRKASI